MEIKALVGEISQLLQMEPEIIEYEQGQVCINWYLEPLRLEIQVLHYEGRFSYWYLGGEWHTGEVDVMGEAKKAIVLARATLESRKQGFLPRSLLPGPFKLTGG